MFGYFSFAPVIGFVRMNRNDEIWEQAQDAMLGDPRKERDQKGILDGEERDMRFDDKYRRAMVHEAGANLVLLGIGS